jgi:hypothetical protein
MNELDDLYRTDYPQFLHNFDEALRRKEADTRREELGEKYAGMNDWTADDWNYMDVEYAKNAAMYERIEADGSIYHLWSEDGRQGKREAACTIKTTYQDGHETTEVRKVMVCSLPEDSEKVIEGKATVRFTWTEKEAKPVKSNKETLSKVCAIANRIPATVSRKDAFIEAWRIVRQGEVLFPVNGVTFLNRQKALARLAKYNPKDIHTILVPEFENQYDSNAIAVMATVNGGRGFYRIGYVPKTETAIAKAFLGRVPTIRILDGDIRGAKLQISI